MTCMPSIEVCGHSFHFLEIEGSEPTVMLLCSTGLDSRQWEGILPLLEGRRVICPHYLCYPGTDWWHGSGEIDSWLDYLACEELLLSESGPIDIVGHSYGGFIALRLAKEHPGMIRKMAFHEPIVWGCLQSTERDDLKDEFGEVVETFFTENLEPEEFLRDFVDYWNVEGSWDGMPQIRKDMWFELEEKILSEVRLLCYDRTPPSYYESIEHPILITLSEESPPHQIEACKIADASLVDSRIVEVPGGHMGVITRSGDVMPHLSGWIK